MKPTLVCGECKAVLTWGDKFCSSCGKPVDVPSEAGVPSLKSRATVRCAQCGAENNDANSYCASCGVALGTAKEEKPRAQEKPASRTGGKKAPEQPITPSWKMMAGFIVFLAVGVFGLQLLTATKIPEVPHTHEQETAGANMQALQKVEEMEKQLAANPNDQPLRLQLANELHDARFYDRAIQRYNEYLQKSPSDADARVDLGICFYETDRTDDAKREMLRALQSSPKHILGHFNLGIVHLRIAQAAMNAGESQKATDAVQEANEWFKKTVALDPTGSAGQRAQRFIAEHSNQPNLPTN